ncbi:MAG: hypothetical protein LH647_16880 [Leptolyngbyaceae cyanobacterium CAN_BIN12]|nr:hypothetical protein [Leptolyngbyaceae cyanobacterium CAN_BIN12]
MITILGRSIQNQATEKWIGDRQIISIRHTAVVIAVYNPSNWEADSVMQKLN